MNHFSECIDDIKMNRNQNMANKQTKNFNRTTCSPLLPTPISKILNSQKQPEWRIKKVRIWKVAKSIPGRFSLPSLGFRVSLFSKIPRKQWFTSFPLPYEDNQRILLLSDIIFFTYIYQPSKNPNLLKENPLISSLFLHFCVFLFLLEGLLSPLCRISSSLCM